MKKYGVGQDEFIFCMYSVALVVISIIPATVKGGLVRGHGLSQSPGYLRRTQFISEQ